MKWQDIKHCEQADVYKGQKLAGKITRTKDGSRFRYDDEFLEHSKSKKHRYGIAYNLPPTQVEYQTKGANLHPYFAGLLPEGLRLKAIVKNVKTSEDDLLSILIAAGADCIGDISVIAGGQLPMEGPPSAHADIDNLQAVRFSDLFDESIYFSDKAGPSSEASIPGIQEKISAGMISFPLKGKRGEGLFILKLSHPRNPKIVENEHFFMKMGKACGLQVASTSVVKDKDGNSGLLVQRFDRCYDAKTSQHKKIHQEDACQFLDIYPSEKYRVSMAQIADGIKRYSSIPILDIGKLIRLQAFSYFTANGDLHAKNISLASNEESGEISMTPCYDIVSTLPFGDNHMALKFEGRDDNLKRKDFVTFGSRYGVREAATNKILDELIHKSATWIGRVEEIGLTEKQTSHLHRTMKKRLEDLA